MIIDTKALLFYLAYYFRWNKFECLWFQLRMAIQ